VELHRRRRTPKNGEEPLVHIAISGPENEVNSGASQSLELGVVFTLTKALSEEPVFRPSGFRVARHSPGTVIAHTGWISDSGRRLCEGSWQRLRTSLAQSHSYKYDPTAFEELSV
jgi:hypothetical protein